MTLRNLEEVHLHGETGIKWDRGRLSPREIDGCVGLVVAVSSHESVTFRGGGGHCCGRLARLAKRQGLLHLFSPAVQTCPAVLSPGPYRITSLIRSPPPHRITKDP